MNGKPEDIILTILIELSLCGLIGRYAGMLLSAFKAKHVKATVKGKKPDNSSQETITQARIELTDLSKVKVNKTAKSLLRLDLWVNWAFIKSFLYFIFVELALYALYLITFENIPWQEVVLVMTDPNDQFQIISQLEDAFIILLTIGIVTNAIIVYFFRELDWSMMLWWLFLPLVFINRFIFEEDVPTILILLSILPIPFYLFLIYQNLQTIKARLQLLPFKKLLILRTFKPEKIIYPMVNSFQAVFRYWTYLGPYMVFSNHKNADQFRISTRLDIYSLLLMYLQFGLISIFFLICFFVEFYPYPPDLSTNGVIRFFAISLIIAALSIYLDNRVSKWCSQKLAEKTDKALNQISTYNWKRHWLKISYPGISLHAPMHTWRSHLKEVVAESDKVIMDLRGFKPGHQGCEFEIEYLFQNANLDDVIFWINGSTDEPYFRQVLSGAFYNVKANTGSAPIGSIKYFKGRTFWRKNSRRLLTALTM